MEITYIEHSGFLLKTRDAGFLFDYYKGGIPDIRPDIPLVVFVSHKHPDHYNPEIFELSKRHPHVQYVVSRDVPVKWRIKEYQEQGIALSERVTVMKKNTTQDIPLVNGKTLHIETLKSTDEGVAYLLTYDGRTIYHAGDLNRWVWREESRQYNDNMERAYLREMEKLRDIHIDVAFVPLDPRQREETFGGMKLFLDYTDTAHVFPMHFWGKYSTIRKFCEKYPEYARQVVCIKGKKQKFQVAGV